MAYVQPPPPRDVEWYGDPRSHGARCDVCPLKGSVHVPYIAPKGVVRLAIVGEGPGRIETIRRTPFCLVPETPVLMSDLSWKALDDVQIGDEILTIQEEPDFNGAGVSGYGMRKWVTAIVTNKWNREAETTRVEMASGRDLIGTGDHKVLTRSNSGKPIWLPLSGLQATEYYNSNMKKVTRNTRHSKIVSIGAPWVHMETREAGWLAGFLDGEGHVAGSQTARAGRTRKKVFGTVGYSQNTGPVADLAADTVKRLGFKLRALDERRSYTGKIICRAHISGGVLESMRFLGALRPIRLLADFRAVIGHMHARCLERDAVMRKSAAGPRRVIDITTTAGTFIANGYVVHNCGPTGELLNEALVEAGINRDAAWVTNAALCVGESDEDNARAAECCAPRLLKELAAHVPADAPILSFGKAATKAVLGVNSILLARGFVWQARDMTDSIKGAEAALRKAQKDDAAGKLKTDKRLVDAGLRVETLKGRAKLAGRTVLPMLHPTFAFIHNETWQPVFSIDLDRAARVLDGRLRLEDLVDRIERVDSLAELKKRTRTFVVTDSVKDIDAVSKLLGPEIACDIETERIKPISPILARTLCVQLSDGDRSIVIGPFDPKRHAAALTRFLKGRTVVFHNGFNFDTVALERDGVSFEGVQIEDTLVAHHTFASHLPQKLDHVVATFLDSGPWKIRFGVRGAEEKGLAPVHGVENELYEYGAADAVVTILAWRAMQGDLAKERAVYEHDKELGLQCKGMQVDGFAVDNERRLMLSKALKHQAAGLKGRMRKLARRPNFAPSKLKEVRHVLFHVLKAPMLNPTATGLASTSNATLEQLRTGGASTIRKGPGDVKKTSGPVVTETSSTRAARFSEALLRWRVAGKIKSTYLDAVQVHKDERSHYTWRPYGTNSGRFSCRLQSCPRWSTKPEDRVREIYVASSGHTLIYFDLSQAEARFAANLSGDPVFIENCKKDVHTGNAKILFPHAREVLDRDSKGKYCPQHGENGHAGAACNCGKPFRDIAKNAGFAVAYLAEADTVFAYLRAHGFPIEFDAVDTMLGLLKNAYKRYYEYVGENVRFVQKNGYLRTALTGRVRYFGFHPKPQEIANCLDEETEALTHRGWVRGFDLRMGDQLLTKNAATGGLEWRPMTKLCLFPKYTGPLYEFKSRSFNAVTTPEHRWLVRDRKKGKDVCATSADLVDGVGNLSIHRTGRYAPHAAPIYTDDFVELIGWILTDGSVTCPRGGGVGKKRSAGVVVYQSERGNPQKVRQIDGLFRRLGVRPDRRRVSRGGVRWHLSGGCNLTREVVRLFPDRTASAEFLLSLTSDQTRLLLRTMLLGDGSRSSHVRFVCRDGMRKDMFQLLCTLCGIATSARWRGPRRPKKQYASIANRPQSKGVWVITLLENNTAQVLVHKRRYGKCKRRVNQVRRLRPGKVRPVWCPIVPNTFFVARRRGDVYITGNTPIQSGIADAMNIRSLALQKTLHKVAPGTMMVAQIHDALILDTPDQFVVWGKDERGKPKAGGPVVEAIEATWAEPVRLQPSIVCREAREFLLPAEIKVAKRWNEF